MQQNSKTVIGPSVSVVVAGCAALCALLIGVALDDIGTGPLSELRLKHMLGCLPGGNRAGVI
jgi:hypothetical protein